MKYNTFFIVVVMLVSMSMTAQDLHPCGTDMGRSQFLQDYQAGKYVMSRNGEDWLVVPMQMHITGEDNGTGRTPELLIGESIQIMNAAFEQAKIQFFLIRPYTYINNSTYHNHTSFRDGRNMMQENNVNDALNIYICADAAGNCGYYSGGPDAIAMNNSCLDPDNQTLAHEIGHMLSLPHPFVGWEGTDYDDTAPTPTFLNGREVEKTDGSNCSLASDGFCDTSPDYLSYRWGCGADSLSNLVQYDPDGVPFQSDGKLIMGYSTGPCRTDFSPEQRDAMCANVIFQREEILNHTREYKPLPDCQQLEVVRPLMRDTFNSNNSEFVWSDIPNVDYYTLQISNTLNFSNLLYDLQLNDTSFIAEGLDSGRFYFWRVTAYAAHAPCIQRSGNLWVYSEESSATIDLDNDETIVTYFDDDELIISATESILQNNQLYVFDITGKQVHQSELGVSNKQRITLPSLRHGVYLIKIAGHSFDRTAKVIKY